MFRVARFTPSTGETPFRAPLLLAKHHARPTGISAMEAKQITVFGGSGFLGRHTVRALAKAGWRIKVASRHPNRGFFPAPPGPGGPDRLRQMRHHRSRPGGSGAPGLAGGGQPSRHSVRSAARASRTSRPPAPAMSPRLRRALGIGQLVHVSAIGADSEVEFPLCPDQGRRRKARARRLSRTP